MNKDELKTKKDWALYYQSIGLSIIPTGANKVSLIKWEPYQDRCATVEEIKRWWSIWPDANPTLVAGEISGVVTLDLDKKHNRTSKEFSIPPTICARSGSGGEHFFFKHPGRNIPSTNGQLFGEGVDLKADGGYILLAPSVNESGGVYDWIVPLESKNDLAEMPEWLVRAIEGHEKTGKKLWQKDPNEILEGSRNETATSIAGKIRSSLPLELLETVGWSGLTAWNQTIPKPLPERELRTVWESVNKYPVGNNQIRKNISSKAITKCFANIQSVPISWLWEGRIAIGKLTMIAGDPGLGKSFVTVNIATNVSKGYNWPVDNSTPPIGDVIFLSAEDDPADTIKPRLEAMGADCNRIYIIEAIQEEAETKNESTQRMFSFKRDIETLSDLLSSLPNCNLVIIDPISAYLDSTDSNNNSDIRGLLAPLSVLAGKHKVAIVLVSHLNKNSSVASAYRVMGSLAFTAAVRTAYIVTKDKDNPERRLFMPLKNNIAKDKKGFAYSIVEGENKMPIIEWEPEAVEMTLDEALGPIQTNDERTATSEAMDFLCILLKSGPLKVNDIQKEAKQACINTKPLRTAYGKLNIKSKKVGFNPGFWIWELPEGAQNNEDAQSRIEGNFEVAGRLRDTKYEKLDDFADYLNPDRKKDKDGIDDIPMKLPEPIPPNKLPF